MSDFRIPNLGCCRHEGRFGSRLTPMNPCSFSRAEAGVVPGLRASVHIRQWRMEML